MQHAWNTLAVIAICFRILHDNLLEFAAFLSIVCHDAASGTNLAAANMTIKPNIRFVQIQTHSRCNADCVFCPWIESEHNTVNRGEMTNGTWQLVLDRLMPFADGINRGKVCPYLMNEPLIDRGIFEKINDIYQRFPS